MISKVQTKLSHDSQSVSSLNRLHEMVSGIEYCAIGLVWQKIADMENDVNIVLLYHSMLLCCFVTDSVRSACVHWDPTLIVMYNEFTNALKIRPVAICRFCPSSFFFF
jgi:hypothetical protein